MTGSALPGHKLAQSALRQRCRPPGPGQFRISELAAAAGAQSTVRPATQLHAIWHLVHATALVLGIPYTKNISSPIPRTGCCIVLWAAWFQDRMVAMLHGSKSALAAAHGVAQRVHLPVAKLADGHHQLKSPPHRVEHRRDGQTCSCRRAAILRCRTPHDLP